MKWLMRSSVGVVLMLTNEQVTNFLESSQPGGADASNIQ